MSRPDAILALDLGTSSLKALLVAETGQVLATARRPYPTEHPAPGYAEQDPAIWWRSAVSAVVEVAGAGRAIAIAVTGQMHGTVVVGARQEPLVPAIIWADERSAREAEALTSHLGTARLLQLCGSPLFPGVQAATIAWLRAHRPQIWRDARAVLLPKDWLALRLTGRLATEPSDAAGTLLLDSERRTWASAVAEALRLPQDLLPEIVPSGEVIGGLTSHAAAELGLPEGTPVILAGGDAPCGAVTASLTGPDRALVLLSTGAQVMQTAASYAPDSLARIHVWPAALPGPPRWNRMGATLNSGLALEWARKLTGRAAAADLLELAATAPAGAHGLLFLPYLIGERTPLMDPSARGGLFGLHESHGPSEFARAVVEGIAFSIREALNAVAASERPAELLLGGGGARHPLWPHLLADALGLPIRRLPIADLSTYGAAMLAAHQLGWIDVGCPPAEWRRLDEAIEPDQQSHQFYRERFELATALFSTTRSLVRNLSRSA